nr:uncharacterized protein LOC111508224 [Leptinotarsa decemlineata]
MAYADDLAIVVKAKKKENLISNGNLAIEKIVDWMTLNGLDTAPQKTENRGPRKREDIKFQIQDTTITPRKYVKYLGVWLDDKYLWNEHVRRTCAKADRQTAALTKLLPNIRGPKTQKRRLLYGVVQSILLYAAPIWERVTAVDKYKNMLLATQRNMLLRVASAYRTVSQQAICVITSIPPVDILVEEKRCKINNREETTAGIKKKKWQETIREW